MAYGERRVLDPAAAHPPAPRPPTPRGRPWLSWSVIGLSVAVYLLEVNTGQPLWQQGSLRGPELVGGQWWRLFTTVFVHGGPLHLFFNMSVVWTLGTVLERGVATWRLALISSITALGAGTFVLLFAFEHHTVGASGMILGWVGAMLPIATLHGRRQLGIWLLQVAIISLLPGVSWQGHLGGFLFGLPCGLLLRNRARYFAQGAPLLLALALACAFGAAFLQGRWAW
jgi:rhomboid protease GluP